MHYTPLLSPCYRVVWAQIQHPSQTLQSLSCTKLINTLVDVNNGMINIMEDQYALNPSFWLFRLQNVKLMMTTYCTAEKILQ